MKSLWVWLQFKAKQRAQTFITNDRRIYKFCVQICENLLIFQAKQAFLTAGAHNSTKFLLFSGGKASRYQNPSEKRLGDNLNSGMSCALHTENVNLIIDLLNQVTEDSQVIWKTQRYILFL